jgi:DNA-binding CsgD family transcriptional regulator
MSDDSPGRGITTAGIALFSLIIVLIALDLTQDYTEGTGAMHVVMELGVLLLAAVGIGLLVQQIYTARVSVRSLQRDLKVVRHESQRWCEDSRILLEGLGTAIQRQFLRWELTPAESEVALLLLKGLSLKEVANMRATSERTVREQARNVYRKARISGRPALAAGPANNLGTACPSRQCSHQQKAAEGVWRASATRCRPGAFWPFAASLIARRGRDGSVDG